MHGVFRSRWVTPLLFPKILLTSARISPIRVINLRRFVPKEGVKSSLQGRINQQKNPSQAIDLPRGAPKFIIGINLNGICFFNRFYFSIDFIFLSQRRVKIIRFCSGDKGYQSSWSIFFALKEVQSSSIYVLILINQLMEIGTPRLIDGCIPNLGIINWMCEFNYCCDFISVLLSHFSGLIWNISSFFLHFWL